MAFQLSEVSSKEEFEAIAPMLYAAFHEPHNTFYEFLNNTQGTYEEQIRAKANRHALAWAANPAQHWLKITDPSKDNVVIAAASWFIYESTPEAARPLEATWQPEGSVIRTFTTQWLGKIRDMQKSSLSKPHMVIDQLATRPNYRNHSAAEMLLRWGLDKADSLNLEIIVNAVPAGWTYYKKFGFVEKGVVNPDMNIEQPSDEWKRLQAVDKKLYWLSRKAH